MYQKKDRFHIIKFLEFTFVHFPNHLHQQCLGNGVSIRTDLVPLVVYKALLVKRICSLNLDFFTSRRQTMKKFCNIIYSFFCEN